MASNWDEYEESSSSDEDSTFKLKPTIAEEPEHRPSRAQYDHVSMPSDNTPQEEINYKKNVTILDQVDRKLLATHKIKISYLNSKVLIEVLEGVLNTATHLNYSYFLKHTLNLK
jgi:hypothetical protein